MNKLLTLCFFLFCAQTLEAQKSDTMFAVLDVLNGYASGFQTMPFHGTSFKIYLHDTVRIKKNISALQSYIGLDTFPVSVLLMDSTLWSQNQVKKFLSKIPRSMIGIRLDDTTFFSVEKNNHDFFMVSDTGMTNFHKRVDPLCKSAVYVNEVIPPLIKMVDLQLQFAHLLDLRKKKKLKEPIYLIVPLDLYLSVDWIARTLNTQIPMCLEYGN